MRHAAYVGCDAKLSNPLDRMAAATYMCRTRRFAMFPAGRIRQTLYFTMLPASSICQTSRFAMWLASRIPQPSMLPASSINQTPRCAIPAFSKPRLQNVAHCNALADSPAFIMSGGFLSCLALLLVRSSCVFVDLPWWAGQPGLREPLEGLREAWIATGACGVLGGLRRLA